MSVRCLVHHVASAAHGTTASHALRAAALVVACPKADLSSVVTWLSSKRDGGHGDVFLLAGIGAVKMRGALSKTVLSPT